MGDSIFFYILALAIGCCFLPYKYQKLSSGCLLILMMLVCGFRAYDVGVDTHNYTEYVISERNIYIDNNQWGPFYAVLRFIARLFYNEETVFLLLMALFTYIPLIYIIKKNSCYPALSVLMFIIPVGNYFVQSLNIARQSIAIVFVLLAATLMKNKKNTAAFFTLVFSFILHPFTFFAFLLFYINKIHLTRKKVYIYILGSMFIGLVGSLSGIGEILNLLAMMTEGSSNPLIHKLAKYGNGNYDIESNFSLIGELSHMLPMAAMCILGINKKTLEDLLYKTMLTGSIITNICVSIIFCERIASTFTIAQVLAVPYIYKVSSLNRRILIIILLVLTILLFIYNFIGDSKLDLWTPYYSIFD